MLMTDKVIDAISNEIFYGSDSWTDSQESYFVDITAEKILNLIFDGVLDPRDKCSVYYSPTIAELSEFLNNHQTVTCHGKIEIKDGECKIQIDGLYTADTSLETDFLKFCVSASILRVENIYLYSRW